MEKSKAEILKELLFEVNDICEDNDLQYILTGDLSKEVKEKKAFPKDVNNISVAMTMGDIERLIKIVNRYDNGDRAIEYILNNKNSSDLQIRYCNNNTTSIDIRNFQNHVNYGIYIRIIPVAKIADAEINKKILRFLKRFYKVSSKPIMKYNMNIRFIVVVIKLMSVVLGRRNIAKLLYRYSNKLEYIDRWDNIRNNDKIRIGRAKFINEDDWEIEAVNIDGVELKVTNAVINRKLEKNSSAKAIERNVIYNTEIPFSRYLDEQIMEQLKKISNMRNTYTKAARKAKKSQRYIKKSWNKYLMARDIVSIKKFYNDSMMLDINEYIRKGNIEACEESMALYLESKKRWANKDFPFLEVLMMDELEQLELKMNQMQQSL